MALVESQRQILAALLAVEGCCLPSSVFLYGHRSTGKHTALGLALDSFSGVAVWVDCVEAYTAPLLYQLLLQRLAEQFRAKELGAQGTSHEDAEQVLVRSVPNSDVFVRQLRDLISSPSSSTSSGQSPALIFVLERAERLRELSSGGGVLSTLLRLQELSGVNCCCVLISTVVWDKFASPACPPPPLRLHFPQFSRQQLHQLLTADGATEAAAGDVDARVYDNFVHVLLFTTYATCRDVCELRHVSATCWPHYVRPVRQGDIVSSDLRALWKNIEPHLRASSRHIFMRQSTTGVPTQQPQQQQSMGSVENGDSGRGGSGGGDSGRGGSGGGDSGRGGSVDGGGEMGCDLGRLNAELPFYSKFLLIAAFLASYNPAKTDRRFFVNARHKRRRQAVRPPKSASRRGQEMALMAGPRTFPLHRLMAIFFFIVEDRVTPSVHLYSQLMSLVSLRLLARVTVPDNIDTCKLRCLTGLSTTRVIAASVDFALDRYLYDFV